MMLYTWMIFLVIFLGTELPIKTVAYRSFYPLKSSKPSIQCLNREHRPWSCRQPKMTLMEHNHYIPNQSVQTKKEKRDLLRTIWNFSRPHTVIGSAISIVALFMFASSPPLWASKLFLSALCRAIIPSIFMNLYITGLNQVTDVEVDKINKPYLPLASGALNYGEGIFLVVSSLILTVLTSWGAEWPLLCTLFGSFLLGTIYSLPPIRLKRFPLLAASCILVVRGSLINLGFLWQAKKTLYNVDGGPLKLLSSFPESALVTLFFAIFGLVIAIMKDVPDINGDKKFNIRTFSVRRGAPRMFKLSHNILNILLSGASIINAGSLFLVLVSRGSMAGINILSSALFSILMMSFALYLRQRASMTNADNENEVFSYYMDVWKVFYGCYLSLPLIPSAT